MGNVDISKLDTVKSELDILLIKLNDVQSDIKTCLQKHADNKLLKGDELVGWLGEIFGKYLYDGALVSDTYEHDFIDSNENRVSVKARKGWADGWQRSSLIRKIEGADSPTHLLFVHFNSDYTIDRIWRYEWPSLIDNGRLKVKTVRGIIIGWQFTVRDVKDSDYLVYNGRL